MSTNRAIFSFFIIFFLSEYFTEAKLKPRFAASITKAPRPTQPITKIIKCKIMLFCF